MSFLVKWTICVIMIRTDSYLEDLCAVVHSELLFRPLLLLEKNDPPAARIAACCQNAGRTDDTNESVGNRAFHSATISTPGNDFVSARRPWTFCVCVAALGG